MGNLEPVESSPGGSWDPEHHEPLGTRVVACLNAHRSLLASYLHGEIRFQDLRTLSEPVDLSDAVSSLREAMAQIDRALFYPVTGKTAARGRRMRDLRAEMQELIAELQEEMLGGQQAMLRGVRNALQRLSGCENTEQLIRLAAAEVCRSCGVDRCVIFRADGNRLNVASVHFVGDVAFQAEWEAYARANPVELSYDDPEAEAMRRQTPILVDETRELNGMQALISAGRATSYVASPIVARGSVVGMIHADRYVADRSVDPIIRDGLGAFAAGLGFVLERNALLQGSKSQLDRIRSMIGEVEGSIESLLHGDLPLLGPTGGQLPPGRLSTEPRMTDLLTRRELEVMELLARGSSNSDIAMRLIISEGTVKSHVKHILRKLGASNRAQAVSAYMRLKALSGL